MNLNRTTDSHDVHNRVAYSTESRDQT